MESLTNSILNIVLLCKTIYTFIILKLLGINGIPAQAFMISSSIPTAVNTAIIAIEMDNHPDIASQAVMTATIFSSITQILVIYNEKYFSRFKIQ